MLISVLLFFCMHRKSGGDMSEMPPDEDRCGAQYNPRVCPVTASAAGNPVPGRLNPTTRRRRQAATSPRRNPDRRVGATAGGRVGGQRVRSPAGLCHGLGRGYGNVPEQVWFRATSRRARVPSSRLRCANYLPASSESRDAVPLSLGAPPLPVSRRTTTALRRSRRGGTSFSNLY